MFRIFLSGAALVAMMSQAAAQTSPFADQTNIAIHGVGFSGAAVVTTVIPPAGNLQLECSNVIGCGSFIATAPAGTNGAQVNHVTVTPTGNIEAQCIHSPLCIAFTIR